MGRLTETVKVLIIINVLFYVGTVFLGGENTSILANKSYQLFALWFPENPNFQIWQVITHMFMHGGTMHIFFNMFMLYMFGSILENHLGQMRFLFLYFSAGLGAFGLQVLFSYFEFHTAYEAYINAGFAEGQISQMLETVSQSGGYNYYENISRATTDQLMDSFMTPMVGASGAIFGVLAAFAVVYPNLPLYLFFIPIPIKAKYLIGFYFAINVISAVTGLDILHPSNTAYWAHIGGAIIGFITMWYWKKNSFNQNRWS